jgi:hypothetical protein
MIAVNRPVIEIPASMTDEPYPSPLQTNWQWTVNSKQ